MVAYQEFVALSRSGDSEARGQAAQLAAAAFLSHTGPADEHAALYAALVGFLDDPSVKVRASLAFGLLHSLDAPRPVMVSLLHDRPVIAQAVAQHSPVLLDTDLLPVVAEGERNLVLAVAQREWLSARLAEAVLGMDVVEATLEVLARRDVRPSHEAFAGLVARQSCQRRVRAALLDRPDLPADQRLLLVEAVSRDLAGLRLVKGSVPANRLERLIRNANDTALTVIGEDQSIAGGPDYAALMVAENRVSTRIMLHALVNGRVFFFAECVAALTEMPRRKVFSILEAGSAPSLHALFRRAGLHNHVIDVLARLIFLARESDLADDLSARHFVVTVLTEEIIVEHGGQIPLELEDAFNYLSEQNVTLARAAARGVMSAFGEDRETMMPLPSVTHEDRLALPAA